MAPDMPRSTSSIQATTAGPEPSANAAMQDFIMHIQARESLERQALRGNA